ncbi:hypothetical protein AG1IA_07666 [Rhizoctonia solani AG-1 IA]|uniref:Uncharacterized protein n=1 Tax=Thanatephorus cucumeris (strain AG1-IA) TaxID=983506 RepID=L8WK74_THACA|nr:hypothetical protein AG1IA_07666 [Rhizoctonia solani AG-1 IA]
MRSSRKNEMGLREQNFRYLMKVSPYTEYMRYRHMDNGIMSRVCWWVQGF